ncbi:hypothetical protein BdWA1_001133 [Babesia duncani]|uniref:NELF-A N-terminal domain-containing protein n=1 Tax=Babesia duncani TaxID=323732 RepID=A0AAD9UQG9_9APIC|nr:hypothetical protein BdWA1_003574 [Babesia duncani]KAK2198128.1 hypothetical protein BdWA1_001133 [Babesia duncani]
MIYEEPEDYHWHFQAESKVADSDVEYLKCIGDNELVALSDQYVEYLKLIKDNWSSCRAAKILSYSLLRYIVPRFRQLSAPLRVRMLTSFLYLKDALRNQCQKKLVKILNFAETDANEWVRKMGQLVRPYVVTGMMDLRLIDTETAFRIITFLDERLAESPHDGEYLRKDGLDNIHISNPESIDSVGESGSRTCKDDETSFYTARLNFDRLGDALVTRAQYKRAQGF